MIFEFKAALVDFWPIGIAWAEASFPKFMSSRLWICVCSHTFVTSTDSPAIFHFHFAVSLNAADANVTPEFSLLCCIRVFSFFYSFSLYLLLLYSLPAMQQMSFTVFTPKVAPICKPMTERQPTLFPIACRQVLPLCTVFQFLLRGKHFGDISA